MSPSRSPAGWRPISGVLGMLTATGSEIVAHSTLYGCTYSLLTNWYPRLKIGVQFIDLTMPGESREGHLGEDARRVCRVAGESDHAAGRPEGRGGHRPDGERERAPKDERIYTVVDSTFATPFCQRPISFGIDFVVHSLTKAIGGFGTDVGGVVIGPAWSRDPLLLYRKDFGGVAVGEERVARPRHGPPVARDAHARRCRRRPERSRSS